jgi:hypothetical protein
MLAKVENYDLAHHDVGTLGCSTWARSMCYYHEAAQEVEPMRVALSVMGADLDVLTKEHLSLCRLL